MATDVPQVGCPHCRGAIAVTAAMLGRVVECPHCRGQLQLPDAIPGMSPGPPAPKPTPPTSAIPTPPKPTLAKKAPIGNGSLTVMTGEDLNFATAEAPEAVEDRNVARFRAEPECFKQLETYAIPFVVCGIAGTLMLSIAIAFYAVVPLFREALTDGVQTQKLIPAILLALAVLAFFCSTIVIWIILRLAILTLLDIARSLRQIRDKKG